MGDGLCRCGCGGKTEIAYKTRAELGWIKGQPMRFLKQHSLRVNPLFIGSHDDNMADGVKKGRFQIGEKRWNAVLTTDKVLKIKELLKQGISQTVIGREFGVSNHVVHKISSGDNWKYATAQA